MRLYTGAGGWDEGIEWLEKKKKNEESLPGFRPVYYECNWLATRLSYNGHISEICGFTAVS